MGLSKEAVEKIKNFMKGRLSKNLSDEEAEIISVGISKITKEDKINSSTENSGFDLEERVKNFLNSKDWKTEKQYYTDPVEGKSREGDWVATKEFPNQRINIKLIISCRYIPIENLFWFTKKDRDKALLYPIRACINSIPESAFLREHSNEIDPHLIKHHYYLGDDISYSSKAIEGKDISGATHQVLNHLFADDKTHHTNDIIYPVVVVNSFSKFLRKEGDGNLLIDNNFQMVFDGYLDIQYSIVDIVSFEKLEEFLNLINNDIEMYKQILKAIFFYKRIREEQHKQRRNNSYI